MNISLVPQRRDAPLHAEKSGDILVLNGEAFDFAPLQEGDELPASAIASDLFAGPVLRHAGSLHLSLVLPIGANAPEDARFPIPLDDVPDGTIPLQDFDVAEPTAEETP